MLFEEDIREDGDPVGDHADFSETQSPAPLLAAQTLLERMQDPDLSAEDRRHTLSGLLRLTISQAVPISAFADLKEQMLNKLLHADEVFGVSRDLSAQVDQVLESLDGKSPAIVTHVQPDLDGASSALHVGALLEARGITSTIHAGDGTVESLKAQLPDSAERIGLRSIEEVGADQPVILVDANEAHAKNVGLPKNIRPTLIIDTHHPKDGGISADTTAIILENHSASITGVIGALLPLVAQEEKEAFLNSEKWSELATWAVLGMISDTANARRAGPFDVEAIYQLLPFLKAEQLSEYENAPFQQHVKGLIRKGRKNLVLEGEGAFTHLGRVAPHARHSASASSDYLIQGTNARGILVCFQVGDKIQASIRVRGVDSEKAEGEVERLAQDVIGKDAGSRKGGVAGGSVPVTAFGNAERTTKVLKELFFLKLAGLEAA